MDFQIGNFVILVGLLSCICHFMEAVYHERDIIIMIIINIYILVCALVETLLRKSLKKTL